MGHINLREFLRQRIPEKVGEIVDSQGQVIGKHPGAWYYTIGQRHGLGIGGSEPYYVAQKDVTANKLTVTTLEYRGLVYHTECPIRDIHWVGEAPKLPFRCHAKIRYQQPDQTCNIEKTKNGYKVIFDKPQFAVASGQSVVFYKGDLVLGGGIIT